MDDYSVPLEARKVLLDGIINNPLHSSCPAELKEAAESIEYVGHDKPTIPVNWRFAESISAIKGFYGSMLNVLMKKKYDIDYQKIVIDTDHAQLFIMSIQMPVIDPFGSKTSDWNDPIFQKYFPDGDKYHAMYGRNIDRAATNIYRTKDGRFYHVHGMVCATSFIYPTEKTPASLNAAPVQSALGIDPTLDVSTFEEACEIYQNKVLRYTAAELDHLMNDEYRQAGTTCWTVDEFKASDHGKANAHVGLFELHHVPNPKQAPGWWTPVDGLTGPARPLFGLKVLDLTRIIAAPTITRGLAELGASVLRIASPSVPDFTVLLPDLGWGKWNAHLDLTKPEDRDRLRALILESDVVVDGYRPGVMKKWGFGKEDILNLVRERERGIIYVHENCYGWNGPWTGHSGWQQISDANTGVSIEFARAMGNDEAVTPVLPNSDFCTGAVGATGVLQALIEQSEKGGSYVLDVALNYYSQWLVNSVSTYPKTVWDELWNTYNRPTLRHTDNMPITLALFAKLLKTTRIMDPRFFEIRENGALGVPFKMIKPILQFPQGLVTPGFNVGARANGTDQPVWPNNLLTEVIV
ncbi:hypothetical protein D9619_010978 [Psilocybe cf. subviscida]|uniref:Uncharacterized protein n=1 Tax=Psilocybe cf. subviscida TaxID=2480587 RepID=A0A8H5BAH7_9AGAR|nr:hypothetical protein D9619_010978 [Psilocybe cf. subviscida]